VVAKKGGASRMPTLYHSTELGEKESSTIEEESVRQRDFCFSKVGRWVISPPGLGKGRNRAGGGVLRSRVVQ